MTSGGMSTGVPAAPVATCISQARWSSHWVRKAWGRDFAMTSVPWLRSIMMRRSPRLATSRRSEEHTSELQSLMRISYAVFCLKKKKRKEIELKQQHTPRIQEENKTQ